MIRIFLWTRELQRSTGQGLETLVNQYREVENIISKLSRTYPQIVLETLLKVSALDKDMLKDENKGFRLGRRDTSLAWCRY